MQAFAELLDRLIYTRSRNAKLALIADYLVATPDPDRGWALAALTGDLDLKTVKSSQIRAMADERFDPLLFRMSRDYVGDTAETVALMWPDPAGGVAFQGDGRGIGQTTPPAPEDRNGRGSAWALSRRAGRIRAAAWQARAGPGGTFRRWRPCGAPAGSRR